ncbi:hypothetical protein ACPA54_16770 [Uniformispora flossi]|uniref:hypothetical protein n=1 Tax=Uniformispora flossi TaxID=3390723 RepID=UPI003C2DE90A
MHLVHSRRPEDEPGGDEPDYVAERAAAALHAAGNGIKPPPWLAPRGLARGRRASRRIRVLAAAGSATAAAVVGTALVLALPGLSGPRDAASSMSPSARQSGNHVTTPPAAVPRPSPTHDRDTAAERLLRTVLPPEVALVDLLPRPEEDGASFAGVLGDAQGSGALTVVVSSGRRTSELTCSGQGSASASCGFVDLPDGTRIRTETHRDRPHDPAGEAGGSADAGDARGVSIFSVHLIRPDGTSVEATATNSDPERIQRTRPTPILTTDQLRTLVTAEGWRSYTAS